MDLPQASRHVLLALLDRTHLAKGRRAVPYVQLARLHQQPALQAVQRVPRAQQERMQVSAPLKLAQAPRHVPRAQQESPLPQGRVVVPRAQQERMQTPQAPRHVPLAQQEIMQMAALRQF